MKISVEKAQELVEQYAGKGKNQSKPDGVGTNKK
jgi:hypothetical protein